MSRDHWPDRPSLGNATRDRLGRYGRRIRRVDERPDRLVAGAFLLLGVALMGAQYSFVAFEVRNVTQFGGDAVRVWYPLAQEVLGGEPLFGPDRFENKPPLWQFLNLGVAWVAQRLGSPGGLVYPYYLLFYALVGLAHGVVAWLLYAWTRRRGSARVGAVAALLFLGGVHAGFMARIDPRPFAAVLILVALSTSRAPVAGAALAAATTLIQYSFLAVPVVLWRALWDRPRRETVRWTAGFGLAGVAVAVAAFGAVAVVWNLATLEYAVRYTVLMTGHYTTTNSVLVSPVKVIGGHLAWATELYYVVLPAGLAVLNFLGGDGGWRSPRGESLLLAVALMVPFLIRPHGMYWYAPLPFLAVLAAFGYRDFFASDGE